MPLLSALFLLIGGLQSGASVPFIEPSSYRAESGQVVRIASAGLAQVGADTVAHAFMMSGAGRSNFDEFFPETLKPADGGTLFGCEYAPLTIDAVSAQKWFNELGIEAVAHGQLRVIRSATTLMRVGNSADSMAAARSGMMTELRPMSDPTLLTGGDLAVRFYGNEQEVAKGANVRATYLPTGQTHSLTTDRAGMARLVAIRPGKWRLAAATLDDNPKGQVLSIATLTFEIPARGGK